MPNVLSPRDLVSRPENMDETVLSSSLGLNRVVDWLHGIQVRLRL